MTTVVTVSEAAERYGRVADGFGRRLAGVPEDGWPRPSPCTEWTARDIAVHVVNVHRRVAANLDGSTPDEVSGDDDLAAAWAAATGAVRSALADPAQAGQVTSGMFGEQSFESLVSRLLCTDTLLHTWDLARATGQDDSLDAEAVTRAREFLGPIDEAIRRPGGFAAKIDPPAGADEQTRLLCFCGRPV